MTITVPNLSLRIPYLCINVVKTADTKWYKGNFDTDTKQILTVRLHLKNIFNVYK